MQNPRKHFSAASSCCPSHLFARRRARPLRSGTIARELHAAPNIIPVLHGTNGRLVPTGPAETLSSRSKGRVN